MTTTTAQNFTGHAKFTGNAKKVIDAAEADDWDVRVVVVGEGTNPNRVIISNPLVEDWEEVLSEITLVIGEGTKPGTFTLIGKPKVRTARQVRDSRTGAAVGVDDALSRLRHASPVTRRLRQVQEEQLEQRLKELRAAFDPDDQRHRTARAALNFMKEQAETAIKSFEEKAAKNGYVDALAWDVGVVMVAEYTIRLVDEMLYFSPGLADASRVRENGGFDLDKARIVGLADACENRAINLFSTVLERAADFQTSGGSPGHRFRADAERIAFARFVQQFLPGHRLRKLLD
jgi:hypothetical protein